MRKIDCYVTILRHFGFALREMHALGDVETRVYCCFKNANNKWHTVMITHKDDDINDEYYRLTFKEVRNWQTVDKKRKDELVSYHVARFT